MDDFGIALSGLASLAIMLWPISFFIHVIPLYKWWSIAAVASSLMLCFFMWAGLAVLIYKALDK